MGKVLDPICASRVCEVPKALADGSDAALCLSIGLVVVCSGHHQVDLEVLHSLLPKAGCELAVSVRDNRGGVAMDGKDFVYHKLCCLFGIDVFGDWKEECVSTEPVKDDTDEFAFLVAWERACEIDG